MKVRVQIDPDVCSSVGMCEIIAPDIFEIVGYTSTVKADQVDIEIAREAAAQCPVGAISFDE